MMRAFSFLTRLRQLNPEKMRSSYGKLVYLLQDSQLTDVKELLGFSMVEPLRTVHSVLAAGGALAMLSDPLMATATAEIEGRGRQRSAVANDIRRKEKAQEYLSNKYASGSSLTAEELQVCLYSIGDNANYLKFNRDPVEKTIAFLHRWFEPRAPEDRAFSLAISTGQGGARLTHSHERQFTFVLQSLTLWREIHHHMFKLWTLAEDDLLRESNVRPTLQRPPGCAPQLTRSWQTHSLLSGIGWRTPGKA